MFKNLTSNQLNRIVTIFMYLFFIFIFVVRTRAVLEIHGIYWIYITLYMASIPLFVLGAWFAFKYRLSRERSILRILLAFSIVNNLTRWMMWFLTPLTCCSILINIIKLFILVWTIYRYMELHCLAVRLERQKMIEEGCAHGD